MKKYLFLFLFSFFVQAAFAQEVADILKEMQPPLKTGNLSGALKKMEEQKTAEKPKWLKELERAGREAERKAREHNILHESPAPVLGVFKEEAKVSLVSMREFFLAGPKDGVSYVGTFGASTCIIVVIVSKKEGRVIKTGLAHVDALCEIEKSGFFFFPSLKEADEVEVYFISSLGYERTALRVWRFLTQLGIEDKEVSYFVNLQGPSGVVVNVQTGEVYGGCEVDWLDISREELARQTDVIATTGNIPSPLSPSKAMKEIYRRRHSED